MLNTIRPVVSVFSIAGVPPRRRSTGCPNTASGFPSLSILRFPPAPRTNLVPRTRPVPHNHESRSCAAHLGTEAGTGATGSSRDRSGELF